MSSFTARDGREFLLRPLKRGDLDPLLEFANSIVDEKRSDHSLGVVSFSKRLTRSQESRFLKGVVDGGRRRKAVDVAALRGAEVVGHCTVTRRQSPDEEHSGVLGIVVRKEYRGLGIGEALMNTALARARRIGVWMVELEVFSSNIGAKRLYRKLGFRKAGTIPKKVQREGNTFDVDVMYLHLGDRQRDSGGRKES